MEEVKMILKEISRCIYGNDHRAINRHFEIVYEDEQGNRYTLSHTLFDVIPSFFEAYGPYSKDFQGILPRLKINNHEYWGDGIRWAKAKKEFCKELNAEIV